MTHAAAAILKEYPDEEYHDLGSSCFTKTTRRRNR